MMKKMGSVGNEDTRMADEGMTVEREEKKKKKRNGNLSGAECLIETSEKGSALVSGFTECEKFKSARVLLRLDSRKQDCPVSIGEVIKSFYRLICFFRLARLDSIRLTRCVPPFLFLVPYDLYDYECETASIVGGIVNLSLTRGDEFKYLFSLKICWNESL